jgi:hypothetical protein
VWQSTTTAVENAQKTAKSTIGKLNEDARNPFVV